MSTFYGCSSLISIIIPNSVTTIVGFAFRDCSSLTSIVVPNSVTSIWPAAFLNCSSLKDVTIGRSVQSIGGGKNGGAFANCPAITDVYCLAESVPTMKTDAFNDSYPEYITLHVPAVSINNYKSTDPWSNFKEVVPIEDITLEKCSTPTITFANGEFTFCCETDGVEYVYDIKVGGAKTGGTDSKVKVTPTFTVSVYATKEGYENSDVATKNIQTVYGDMSGDGEVDATDITKLIDIILKKNTNINTEQ